MNGADVGTIAEIWQIEMGREALLESYQDICRDGADSVPVMRSWRPRWLPLPQPPSRAAPARAALPHSATPRLLSKQMARTATRYCNCRTAA